jgi:hypothetical protein
MTMKTSIVVITSGVLCIVVRVMIGVDGASPPAAANHASALQPPRGGVPRSWPERPFVAAPLVPSNGARLDDAAAKAVHDGELSGANAERSFDDVRDHLERFFNSDTGNTVWTPSAVDTVTRGVQAVLPPGSRLAHVECRGALCRIETSHFDVDEFRTYARDAFSNSGTRVGLGGAFAGLLAEPTPGSPVRAVAYLARDGSELPSVAALFAAR